MAFEVLKKPSLLMLMKSKTGIQSFAGVHAASILLYFYLLDFYARACYFKDRTSLSTPSALPPENAPDTILIPECWPTYRSYYNLCTFFRVGDDTPCGRAFDQPCGVLWSLLTFRAS